MKKIWYGLRNALRRLRRGKSQALFDLAAFRIARPACEFANRAFAVLDSFSDDEVILRTGRAKSVVEELIPIALLGRYFDVPERRVHCQYLGEHDDEADGELRLAGRAVDLGFWPDRILIEVTCAEKGVTAYLRREALVRNGGVFSGNDISRSGPRRDPNSIIISRPVVRDGDSGISDAAKLAKEAFDRKVAKGYSPERLLLVKVAADFHVTNERLFAVARQSGISARGIGILAVFLVDTSTGCIIEVP